MLIISIAALVLIVVAVVVWRLKKAPFRIGEWRDDP
jgi:hypothetical protein